MPQKWTAVTAAAKNLNPPSFGYTWIYLKIRWNIVKIHIWSWQVCFSSPSFSAQAFDVGIGLEALMAPSC